MWSVGDRVEEGVPDLCLEFHTLQKRFKSQSYFMFIISQLARQHAQQNAETLPQVSELRALRKEKDVRCHFELDILNPLLYFTDI
jgi:ABC-type uncharacterized transport system substrate-binding protein